MNIATHKVRSFIVEELRFSGPPEQLSADYPLLDNGVIDSLGLMQIVQLLEDDCGVEIADGDIVPENFASLAAIENLVESKRQ
jgi:acyl carrier protein